MLLKVKLSVLFAVLILSFFHSAEAEVITLKSGKVIDGEIIEKTKDYIKVKYNGQEIYYENKYIKSIEAASPDVSAATAQKEKAPESTTSSSKGG